jgi:3',5'-cyclic AMP phosphodiesterase CpdA
LALASRIRILHLSDLHFGKHSDPVAESVLAFASALERPLDLCVVTGDLTQRARSHQFHGAVAFLRRLSCPVVCIPGNHDVPLYNPWRRFFRPFGKYDRIVSPHFPQFHEDEEVVIAGIRSNDVYTVAEGRLTESHVRSLERAFGGRAEKLKIIVTHHPLVVEHPGNPLLDRLLQLKPHLVLSGHGHQSGLRSFSLEDTHRVHCVSAGTAISLRTRREVNSFNLVDFYHEVGEVRVETFVHSNRDAGFESGATEIFRAGGAG